MPEWTAEARDVQELVMVLTSRYEKASLRVQYIREKNTDVTIILVPSNVINISLELYILQKYVFYKHVT